MRPGLATLMHAWRELAESGAVTLHEARTPLSARTLHYADIVRPQAAQIMIAAGVHGDEPATPWALLSLVRDGLLDARYGYRLWFCTNPSGYDLGTRANCDGRDINRSYTGEGLTPEAAMIMQASRHTDYRLVMDLHEDFEGDGFYLYEPVVGGEAPLGLPVMSAIEDAGFPLQEFHAAYDLGYPEELAHEMCRMERGRVLPDIERESAFYKDGLPLTMYLLGRGAERTLTFESPRRFLWDDRIAMHRTAVVTAIETLTAMHAP